MPRWLCKQPNGHYCQFSTIVDAITEYDGGRNYWWEKMRDVGGIAYADRALQNADDEIETGIPHGKKQERLYRWNEAVESSIFRIKTGGPDPEGFSELKKIIVKCGDNLERWDAEFAKEISQEYD